jgi:putative ABC transport system permease protein
MNLATARSAKRAAEVGIRKVLGAEKNELVRQFLGESMMLALISFAIAIVLVVLLLPSFGEMAGAQLRFDLANHYGLWIGFGALTIIAGLLAGVILRFIFPHSDLSRY